MGSKIRDTPPLPALALMAYIVAAVIRGEIVDVPTCSPSTVLLLRVVGYCVLGTALHTIWVLGTTDPGSLPAGGAGLEGGAGLLSGVGDSKALGVGVGAGVGVGTEGAAVHSRHCRVCFALRPEGMAVHHCRRCGRCVTGFDHHCGILGVCIGSRNISLFRRLLWSGAAGHFVLFLVCCGSLGPPSHSLFRVTEIAYEHLLLDVHLRQLALEVLAEGMRSYVLWYLLGVSACLAFFGCFYAWMDTHGTSYHQVNRNLIFGPTHSLGREVNKTPLYGEGALPTVPTPTSASGSDPRPPISTYLSSPLSSPLLTLDYAFPRLSQALDCLHSALDLKHISSICACLTLTPTIRWQANLIIILPYLLYAARQLTPLRVLDPTENIMYIVPPQLVITATFIVACADIKLSRMSRPSVTLFLLCVGLFLLCTTIPLVPMTISEYVPKYHFSNTLLKKKTNVFVPLLQFGYEQLFLIAALVFMGPAAYLMRAVVLARPAGLWAAEAAKAGGAGGQMGLAGLVPRLEGNQEGMQGVGLEGVGGGKGEGVEGMGKDQVIGKQVGKPGMGLLGMSVGNVAKHGAKHRVARESHGGEYRDREFVDSREYRDSRDSFWEVRDRGRARQGSECRERESRETLDSRDSRDSGHSDPFTFPPAAFSHYCHSCDRRSRLQDHHCGVVGTCIHAGNRSLFVRFVELSGLSLALFLPSFWVLVSHQWELLLYSTDILRAEPRAPLDEAIIWRYFYLVLPMVFVLQSVGLLFFHVFVLGQQYSYNAHAHQVEALYATLCRDTPAQTWPVSQVAKMLEADGSITLSMMQTLHSKSVSTRFTEDLISDIRLRSPYAYTQTYAV